MTLELYSSCYVTLLDPLGDLLLFWIIFATRKKAQDEYQPYFMMLSGQVLGYSDRIAAFQAKRRA